MYVVNPTSKNPIFQINQHIGFDKDVVDEEGKVIQPGDGQGIDGLIFANEVLSLNDADLDEIIFYVNSQGGDVQKSLDMFNAISMSRKKTHAIITGFAYSCAGWIPLAADKVDMVQETGSWMCHMPYNPDNPDEKSQFMDTVVDIISKTIASKSGRNGMPKKTQEEVKQLMKVRTQWDAERMLKEGLIDKIVNASGKVVRLEKDPITLNKTELNFYYKEYQAAQNKMVADKEFGEDERDKLAKEGKALPDGSFPIVTEQDLKNAIHAYGRAKDKEKAKSHIEKRAKEMGLTKLIPDNWKNNSQQKTNIMPFEKLVNRMNKIDPKAAGFKINLSEDATEHDITDVIVRLENRLRAQNDDMMDKEENARKVAEDKEKIILDNKMAMDAAKKMADDKEKEAKDATDCYNKMKEAHDKMEMENKSMKEKEEARNAEVKAADLKFRQERAKNYVERLIAGGKVIATAEMTIEKATEYLTNKATDHYEDVVTQFSLAPVKLSGAKPKFGMVKNEGKESLNIVEKLAADNREKISKNKYVLDGGVLNAENKFAGVN